MRTAQAFPSCAATAATVKSVEIPKGLRHRVASDLRHVDSICRDARNLLICHGLDDNAFAVDLLLREFLNNAIIHGNRLDLDKRAEATVRIGRSWIVLTVQDEGSGFDWRSRRRAPPLDDATSGRGLAIGMHYAHRMKFNREGNQVMLWIKKDDKKAPAGTAPFEISRDGKLARVSLHDKLTAVEVPVLQPALKEELAAGVEEIIFDLAAIETIDSTGIGLLIAANNSLTMQQGEVCLVNVSPNIMKLLQSMRLVERLHAMSGER